MSSRGSSTRAGSTAAAIAAACLLLTLAVPAAAQQPAGTTGRLLGVFDRQSGRAIEGATVRDLRTGTHGLTSRDGAVALGFLTWAGDSAFIEVTRLGFTPIRLGLSAHDTVAVTLFMEPAVVLEAVVTTAPWHVTRDPGARAGFERRCTVKFVGCLRGEEWADKPALSLVDVLADMRSSGVQKKCSGRLRNCRIMLGRCEPKYFVDGHRWMPFRRTDNPLAELDRFLASHNVAGIEVYREELTPLRFRVEPCAAAVVIWTE